MVKLVLLWNAESLGCPYEVSPYVHERSFLEQKKKKKNPLQPYVNGMSICFMYEKCKIDAEIARPAPIMAAKYTCFPFKSKGLLI